MAKVDGPLFGVEATGELAGTLAFKLGKTYCRLEKKRAPSRSRTSGQAGQRDAFDLARSAWLGLSPEERAAWRAGAPLGWTGFNSYLHQTLSDMTAYLGGLIFGESILSEGGAAPGTDESQYVDHFPASADEIPVYADEADTLLAWQINRLYLSILAVQAYLIENKSTIERG